MFTAYLKYRDELRDKFKTLKNRKTKHRCVTNLKPLKIGNKTSLKPETLRERLYVTSVSTYHARNSFVGCIVKSFEFL